jgi:hypothetical protein
MKNIKVLIISLSLTASLNALALIKVNSTTAEPTAQTLPTTVSPTSNPQTFPTYQDSGPVGVNVFQGVSDAETVTATTSGTTTNINTTWTNANTQTPINFNPNTNTSSTTTTSSTSGTNPLLSTVPQFNVMDVKVTASGNCEVKKNGAVIMSGPIAGSPCQKIYGNSVSQSSTGTSPTINSLPLHYQPLNMDVAAEYDSINSAHQQLFQGQTY